MSGTDLDPGAGCEAYHAYYLVLSSDYHTGNLSRERGEHHALLASKEREREHFENQARAEYEARVKATVRTQTLVDALRDREALIATLRTALTASQERVREAEGLLQEAFDLLTLVSQWRERGVNPRHNAWYPKAQAFLRKSPAAKGGE